jgi:hypothetical protein
VDVPGVAVSVAGLVFTASGATTEKLVVAGLLLPPALLLMAVTLLLPPTKLNPLVDQAPVTGLVVRESGPLDEPGPPVSVTVLPGVAVPEIRGLLVATVCPLVGPLMATVGGGTVVKLTGTLVEPPGPVAVTVNVLGPVGRPAIGPQANVLEVAVVLHTVAPVGSVMVITLPGVVVPDTIGEAVVLTFTGELTLRLGGPTAVKLLMAGVETPPTLVATAVTLLGPAVKVRLKQA